MMRRTALAVACLALSAPRATAEGFETPPVLQAKKILPARLLRGSGFHVAERVPTDGLTTQFALESDVGSFPARGRRILEIREREVGAIRELQKTSRSEVFVDAMKGTAMRPVKAAANMIQKPGETLKGLPEGLGRFFDRVASGAERVYDAAAAAHDAGDGAVLVASKSVEATRDALGYEQERRNLARRLGVDPYTSNAVLSEQLDEVTKVAFTARLGVNTLISGAVPGSLAITGTSAANDLVYDTPRGDLVVRVEERLRAAGASDAQLRAFQRNPNSRSPSRPASPKRWQASRASADARVRSSSRRASSRKIRPASCSSRWCSSRESIEGTGTSPSC
jgi:hypothetical protein